MLVYGLLAFKTSVIVISQSANTVALTTVSRRRTPVKRLNFQSDEENLIVSLRLSRPGERAHMYLTRTLQLELGSCCTPGLVVAPLGRL